MAGIGKGAPAHASKRAILRWYPSEGSPLGCEAVSGQFGSLDVGSLFFEPGLAPSTFITMKRSVASTAWPAQLQLGEANEFLESFEGVAAVGVPSQGPTGAWGQIGRAHV